jgi:transposase
VSALTLVAAVDKIGRFAKAKQLTAYNGIVPTVRSSGEREQQGSITRQGRSELRAVWIQAAHSLVRSRQPAARPFVALCSDGFGKWPAAEGYVQEL